ncbi:MAG: exodeoxyribonuclease V subunit gamma [Ignavibacteriaceae bacterium]|nr:exodeoxyribonuclease V subunit gamma [Ignavibacteriaceae bacterium]
MILYKGKNPPQSWDETKFFRDYNSEDFLVIVPTNRKSRDLKRKLTVSAATGINTEGINSFVSKIAKAAGFRFRLTNDTINSIFISQLAGAFSEELNFISKQKTELPQGTVRMFGNMISEYKRYGIYPSDIYEKIGAAGGLSEYDKGKARDFARIYAELNRVFDENNIADYGDLYRKIIASPEAAGAAFGKLYPKVKTIYAAGISEFTLPESQVFRTVSDSSGTEIIINIDCISRNRPLFSINLRSAEQFERLGFMKIEDETTDDYTFAGYLRGNLFMTGGKAIEAPGLKNAPVFYEMPGFNIRSETDQVLKQIKLLILEKNVSYRDICIVTPDSETYAPVFRNKSSRYGIPLNLTYQYHGDDSEAVNFITGLFSVLVSDFSYRDVSRLSYSRYRSLMPVRFDVIRKLMHRRAIQRGFTKIVKILTEAEAAGLEAAGTTHEEVEKSIEMLSRFREEFSRAYTVKEWKEKFESFVLKLGMVKGIIRLKHPAVEVDFGGLRAFLFQLREVLSAEEAFGKKNQLSCAEFLKVLEDISATVRFNAEERPESGVLVTSPEEIRGLRFDYIFICGLTEQVFPGRYRPALILDGEYHRSENNHYHEKRNLFYQTIAAAEKTVYFSYPVTEGDREFAVSHFLRELKQITSVYAITGVKAGINPGDEETAAFRNATREFYNPVIISGDDLLIKASNLKELISEEFGEEYQNKVERSIEILKNRAADKRTGKRIVLREDGELNEFTGKISHPKLTGRKSFSITALESYAGCPFRHLVEFLLKLEQEEEPEETITARQKGTLIHKIMSDFFTRLKNREKGLVIRGCTDSEFERAAVILQEIAKSRISEFEELEDLDRTTITEEMLGIKGEFSESLLFHFLLEERSKAGDDLPSLFEEAFNEFEPENEKLAGYKFSMKMDRVDTAADAGENAFRVIDYKTGKSPAPVEFEKGRSFQLQFYSRALRQLFMTETEEPEILVPHVFSFKRDPKEFGYKDIDKGWDDDSVFEIVENLVSNFTEGYFPLTAEPGSGDAPCKYCDKKSICRVNEKI